MYLGRIKEFYKTVPKIGDNPVVKRGSAKLLDAADPEQPLTWEDLASDYGLLSPKNTHPMDVVRLSEEEQIYIRAIERRGEYIQATEDQVINDPRYERRGRR